MLKQIKKATSLLMVVVLALLVFAPVAASAQMITTEKNAFASSNALYSIRGAQASDSLCKNLARFNVTVNKDTLIEVIPRGKQDDSTALAVTTLEGPTVVRSVFVTYDENGEVLPISVPNERATTASGAFGDELDPFGNRRLVVAWGVAYNRFVSDGRYCYQPYYAQIMYENNANYSVTYMGLDYKCYGYELNYPSFVDRNEPFVLHRMQISQNNPSQNRIYGNTDAYRTDRVLCVNPGGGYHSAKYTMTINGTTDSWTDYIPLEE